VCCRAAFESDVRTQGQYQSMDKRFIGLIFSVFSEDKQSKVGREVEGTSR
ncbi:unnamed protein product, partial [Scytosiphon promiscuus]